MDAALTARFKITLITCLAFHRLKGIGLLEDAINPAAQQSLLHLQQPGSD